MKILDLYVARIFLVCFFLVILVPGVLFSLFELISQLDLVGKGTFNTGDAISIVLFTSPERFIELVPISVFLGALAGLGRLSDRGELIAMEAVGRSVLGVSAGIVSACLLIILLSLVTGEFVVPFLGQKAAAIRLKAKTNKGVTFTEGGFWAKRNNTFIHVGSVAGKSTAEKISIYRFDANGTLESYISALSATINKSDWTLHDVTVRRISGLETSTEHLPVLRVEAFLKTKDMKALELSPESLSSRDLWRYIKALKKGGQNPDHFVLALWRKLTRPLFSLSLAMLAAGLVFQATGRGSMGPRLTMGIVAGLIFYFFDQITMQLGLLWGINPVVTAFVPVVVAASGAGFQIKRVM